MSTDRIWELLVVVEESVEGILVEQREQGEMEQDPTLSPPSTVHLPSTTSHFSRPLPLPSVATAVFPPHLATLPPTVFRHPSIDMFLPVLLNPMVYRPTELQNIMHMMPTSRTATLSTTVQRQGL